MDIWIGGQADCPLFHVSLKIRCLPVKYAVDVTASD
jgi:hypothetical protein